MGKILLIDDSKDTHLILQQVFDNDHVLKSAYNLHQAKVIMEHENFDLILLDIGLPDGDGLEFCADLRTRKSTQETPIIFLTGKDEISAKSIGFSLGAEDYIVKPFNVAEVKLRCVSKLRKYLERDRREAVQTIGDLRFEVPSQRAFLRKDGGEKRLDLTPTGFKLLFYFCQNESQIFTRDQLISAIWGQGTFIVERTVDTHIGAIRKQLVGSSTTIQAVHGYGYRLSAEIEKAKKVA